VLTQALIENKPAEGSGTFDVTNPATDEVIAQVPSLAEDQVRAAIGAAHEAWPEWRAKTASERADLIVRLSFLMDRDTDRLARIMTSEQGKPLAEARGEIAYARAFLDWSAEEGKRIYGETIPASQADKRILVLRQPVGVSAIITPWNFPSAMITRKLGPALACGCPVVIKPAEDTPLSALAIGELAVEAGFPPGVINIVTGDPEMIGDVFTSDDRVRKLSFTGSTEVGRILMRKASQNVLRLSLELGGHAPFIVFDDADLDRAVTHAVGSKFRNGGQTCICANRFYVQGGIYDGFVERLASAMESLRVGVGTQDGVNIGPLINDSAIEKVERHVADARDKGGGITIGGERYKANGYADRFYTPTLIDGMTGEMLCSREETFGPVAPVARFSTEDEAVRMANDTQYGLAGYFFTRDASRLMRVAEALEYGIVGANDALPSTAQAPFGGVKHSGFGREGGKYAMDEYLETKFVSWVL